MTTETYMLPEGFVETLLDLAIQHKKRVRIAYIDKKGNPEARTIEPFFFLNEKKTTFQAHCLLRDSIRHFNVDRIMRITLLDVDRTNEPKPKEEVNS